MALREVQELTKRYRVVVAVPEGPLREDFARVAPVRRGSATMPLVRMSRGQAFKRVTRNLIEVARWIDLLKRGHASLLVVNSTVVVAPVVAARLCGVPVLVHARDILDTPSARRLMALHKRMASTIVAISSDIERSLGTPSSARIVRIPYGIEPASDLAPGDVPDRASGTGLRLAVVGTVEKRKGQDVALEAVGRLQAAGVPAELVLFGREQEPEFAAQLRARAEQLGLADRLNLMGSVTNVGAELATVDVVLGPSRAEPLGLALMEAMVLGKPVVASRVGGIPEFIEDGITGVLVTPGSAEELADAVARLVADPDSSKRMGAAARRFITQHFTLDRTMRSYADEVAALVDAVAP